MHILRLPKMGRMAIVAGMMSVAVASSLRAEPAQLDNLMHPKPKSGSTAGEIRDAIKNSQARQNANKKPDTQKSESKNK